MKNGKNEHRIINVQIPRDLFAEICAYFEVGVKKKKEEADVEFIKNGLQNKVNSILKRFEYEDKLKEKENKKRQSK